MSHPDRGKTGLAAILALALLAGLLFANLMYVNGQTEHKRTILPIEDPGPGDRLVIRGKIQAEPGDRVSIDWYPFGAGGVSIGEVDLHVVEQGEGQLIVNGTTPPHVYVARTGVTLEEADQVGTLTFTRPAVNQSTVEDPFDLPGDEVDIVWTFHFREGQGLPENDTARRLILLGLQDDLIGADQVAITRASAVRAQPWFYAGEALLGVAAVGLGGLTLWPSGRASKLEEEATDTEALIALVERGETYLANLRNLLVITGVLLFFLGMFGVVAIDDVFLLAIDPGAPGDTWEVWMERGFAFVWLSLVATWLILLVAVQRALMRWREHAKDRPLDL